MFEHLASQLHLKVCGRDSLFCCLCSCSPDGKRFVEYNTQVESEWNLNIRYLNLVPRVTPKGTLNFNYTDVWGKLVPFWEGRASELWQKVSEYPSGLIELPINGYTNPRIYIYIYRERERYICVDEICVYIYIYIYVKTYVKNKLWLNWNHNIL